MKGGLDFYLVKNVFLILLQAFAFYFNWFVLLSYLFDKSRYVYFVISTLLLVYICYTITWPLLNFALLIIYPEMVAIPNRGNNWQLPSDFWSILSGLVCYILAILSSTILFLLYVRTNDKTSNHLSDADLAEKQYEAQNVLLIKDGKLLHRIHVKDVLFIEGLKGYVK